MAYFVYVVITSNFQIEQLRIRDVSTVEKQIAGAFRMLIFRLFKFLNEREIKTIKQLKAQFR